MSKGTCARAIIVGRMGKDIEIREIGNNGTKKGEVSLAVNHGYGDRQSTSWFNLVIWNQKKMEVLQDYAGKGCLIMVDGELQIREYDKGGERRYITEIVVGFDGVVEIVKGLDRPEDGEGRGRSSPPPPPPASRNQSFERDIDDDVPF